MLKAVVCVVAAITATACAARGDVRGPAAAPPSADPRGQPPRESLETFIGKVRGLSAQARPPTSVLRTVEASDPLLAAALLTLASSNTAENHRAVAEEYARLGILDKAHEHLSAAAAVDPRDAAAWDRMARLWRDSGFLDLGLSDAHRAVYFAPSSPVVHNTLGTVLQAVGRRKEARAEYEKALQLDPSAAYALNNLCYSRALDGEGREAVRACERALQLQPDVEATRNNLALAYAASGNLDDAAQAFASGGRRARAQYNLGLVLLARRRYVDAVKAFEAAQTLRPGFRAAQVMAREALNRANEERQP